MSKEVIRPSQFAHSKSKLVLDPQLASSPEHQEEMAALYSGLLDSFQPGKIVKGQIVKVDSDGVLVDINYKSRGLVPKYEFSAHELKSLQEGQEIEVLLETLENIDGTVVLSYEQAKAMRAWDAIVKLFEENKPIEGMVTHKVKGGLNVDIGIPAFLPGSQIDLQRVTDFDQYVGQTITAFILKINKKRGNVIISRRKYLSTQRSDARKKILDTLQENQVIQGIVKNITNYGVFIDIGGVDGLLHIIDMTWGRIAHPSEMVKIGETITVKVLSFDKEHEKISLGLKQLSENPWADIDQRLKVGDHIKGNIASITDYGLFVEVVPGTEGLVHISEISWTDRISNLHSRFSVGQNIEVLIVSIDKAHRRMSLSIKQLEKSPWETIDQHFKVGQKIKGKISNIIDFGIFVQLMAGIDGLVRVSDLSWTEHVDHPGNKYKIGEEVEAVVLAIDKEHKRISLGIKQLQADPWGTAEQDYPIGSIIEGEISKITNFGAFVRLPSGIEGLIHNSTLQDDQGKRAEELFKVGQKEQFRVTNVNKEEHKLGLSMRLEGKKEEQPRQAQERKRPERQATSNQQRQSSNQHNDESSHASPAQPTRLKSALQMALEEAMSKNDDKTSK
jgi:small subunit ribosomal protein S1